MWLKNFWIENPLDLALILLIIYFKCSSFCYTKSNTSNQNFQTKQTKWMNIADRY